MEASIPVDGLEESIIVGCRVFLILGLGFDEAPAAMERLRSRRGGQGSGEDEERRGQLGAGPD